MFYSHIKHDIDKDNCVGKNFDLINWEETLTYFYSMRITTSYSLNKGSQYICIF